MPLTGAPRSKSERRHPNCCTLLSSQGGPKGPRRRTLVTTGVSSLVSSKRAWILTSPLEGGTQSSHLQMGRLSCLVQLTESNLVPTDWSLGLVLNRRPGWCFSRLLCNLYKVAQIASPATARSTVVDKWIRVEAHAAFLHRNLHCLPPHPRNPPPMRIR